MSDFSPLVMEDLSNGGPHFRLTEPLTFRKWTVPAGFVTDLASIPRLVWNILPPVGAYDKAAVVHDYLYQHNGLTRAEADQVLEDGMKDLKVNGLKLRVIYWAVRAGGWKPWNAYRAAEKGAR